MYVAELSETGELTDVFKPAVYFDTTFIIDYALVEDDDVPEDARFVSDDLIEDMNKVIRKVLASDKHLDQMSRLRKKIAYAAPKITPIVSPLGILEFIKWNADVGFRNLALNVAGPWPMKRIGDKDVGDKINRLLQMRGLETKSTPTPKSEYISTDEGSKKYTGTALQHIIGELWLNRTYVETHSLFGLFRADVVNFNFSIDHSWSEPSEFSVLQVGAADIMHLRIAQHLGCKYFASKDGDFKRARSIIEKETGMTLITNADELSDMM